MIDSIGRRTGPVVAHSTPAIKKKITHESKASGRAAPSFSTVDLVNISQSLPQASFDTSSFWTGYRVQLTLLLHHNLCVFVNDDEPSFVSSLFSRDRRTIADGCPSVEWCYTNNKPDISFIIINPPPARCCQLLHPHTHTQNTLLQKRRRHVVSHHIRYTHDMSSHDNIFNNKNGRRYIML